MSDNVYDPNEHIIEILSEVRKELTKIRELLEKKAETNEWFYEQMDTEAKKMTNAVGDHYNCAVCGCSWYTQQEANLCPHRM
jgi:hypothetical protein